MTLQQFKPGLLAAVVLAVITSLPQIYLCYERGSKWNGAYAYLDGDEFAYSAYVNALIDGRPRRNDPYTGQDGGPFETLFSIQFIPPYAIAFLARIFGVSAATAFIILLPLGTIASALILFCLLFEITKKSVVSAIGAMGVLCFGGLVTQAPWRFWIIPVAFPFLRRYMPAFPFPFFFAMALFMWRALTRNALIWSVFSGMMLVVLIYSYFFLWTAAVAWLATLMILWMLARPRDYRIIFRVFGITLLIGAVALVPYIWLLAHRASVIDQAQLLDFTHRPDLFRGPELYSISILAVILACARRGTNWRDARILFILSFTLAPFLVFNEQVLTGRSLQPFHYEQFIANYWIVTALLIAFGLVSPNLPRRIPFYLGVASVGVGLILGVADSTDRLNSKIEVDKGREVALKLKGHDGLALISSPLTDSLATTTSNPVLWAQYLYTFSHADSKERKLRFHKYLYYLGVTKEGLRASLEHEGYSARSELFGLERVNPILAVNARPITPQEIEEASNEYQQFTLTFSRSDAASPLLAYAIVSPTNNLSNLDKWYERDGGERVGDFIIYRLTLK
jgi:hypothetical protein